MNDLVNDLSTNVLELQRELCEVLTWAPGKCWYQILLQKSAIPRGKKLGFVCYIMYITGNYSNYLILYFYLDLFQKYILAQVRPVYTSIDGWNVQASDPNPTR